MPKQIKDFDLKENIDGLEDLLIQDSDGLTKRIKASKLMDEIDLSNYYTRAEVNDLLSNIDMSIAMADYYNKEAIDNLLANKANASDIQNLATKEELNDKANTSHRHIQADILDLSVPTKVSQLTNDSGFIASIPDEYVTESELNAKGYLTEHQDIAGKADINHVHSYNDLLDKPTIPSLNGYATETYVNQEIEELNMRIEELFQSVSNGKELLASALTDKGIPTLATESFEQIAQKILSLGAGETEELFNLITKNNDILVTKNGDSLIYKGVM